MIKNINEKEKSPIVNNIFNDENLKAFPIRSGTGHFYSTF